MIKRTIAILSLCVFFVALLSCKDSPTDKGSDSSSAFVPSDGEALFILGQASEQHMRDYIEEVQGDPLPAGFAFYTSLSGNATANDMGRHINFLRDYPNSTLQLAIWTGERQWGTPGYYLDEILSGEHDQNIITLAEACKSMNRPIYIRFGYEFDGWHNAYPPDKYIAAYRYFVDMMRDHGVTNVAYVWHSWGVGAYYGSEDYPDLYPELGRAATQELWYPGDDYVDWIAISVFGTGWGNLRTNTVIQYLLGLAEDHDKPLMLAESAAIKTTEQSDPNWVIQSTSWHANVFNFINNNNAVKAFTYINVDWEGDNPSSTWGDTRIQAASPAVQSYWLNNVGSLLHANENLFETLGFN